LRALIGVDFLNSKRDFRNCHCWKGELRVTLDEPCNNNSIGRLFQRFRNDVCIKEY
jgi:hypothetical protein